MKRLAAVSALFLLGACAHAELAPGPGAEQVAGVKGAAEATVKGVHVVVDGESWPGSSTVFDYATPVKVTIENKSDHPLRLRFKDFSLLGTSGVVLTSLPPYKAARSANEAVATLAPPYPWAGFYVAPWYSPYYPDLDVWPDEFGWEPDWDWYDEGLAYWPSEAPSQSIMQYALPEGVVKVDGSVTGYLYFHGLGELGPQVTFRDSLVDAKTGEEFGKVEIPFVVKK